MTNLSRPSVVRLTCAAIAGLTLLSACGKQQPQQTPPPTPVGVVTVEERAIPLQLNYMARTAGVREVEVRARVSGILQRRLYQEGQRVNAGDLLFRIDAAPYAAEVARAKAQLGVEEARFSEAKQQRERAVPLLEQKAISRRDYDQAIAAAASAEATVAAARAALEKAELDLSYTEVRAPIAGLTSREARSEGSLVTAGSDSSLLTRIVQTDTLYIEFSMPAEEAASLRSVLGQTKSGVQVRLQTAQGENLSQAAEIKFIDTAVDQASGTVLARATLNNAGSKLLPGQFLRANIEGVMLPKASVIPSRAVLRSAMGTMVWVVGEGDKVQPRPVQLGETSGNEVAVISGLKAGERVIADGVIKVHPDAVVAPVPVEEAAGGNKALAQDGSAAQGAPQKPAQQPAEAPPAKPDAQPKKAH